MRMRFPPPKPSGNRSDNLLLDIPSCTFPRITITQGEVFPGTTLNRTTTGVFVRFKDERIPKDGFLLGSSLPPGRSVMVRIARIQRGGDRVLIGLKLETGVSAPPAPLPQAAPTAASPVISEREAEPPAQSQPVDQLTVRSGTYNIERATDDGCRVSSAKYDNTNYHYVHIGTERLLMPFRLMTSVEIARSPDCPSVEIIRTGVKNEAGEDICARADFLPTAGKLLQMIKEGTRFAIATSDFVDYWEIAGRSVPLDEQILAIVGGVFGDIVDPFSR